MCCANPVLPDDMAPKPAAISVRKIAIGGAVALLAAWVGYTTQVFEGRRTLTWYEVCTDGWSPDWLASESQNLLGMYYKEALNRGFLDDIKGAVLDHLSQWGGGDVLELCAGAGGSASVWHSLFVEKGLCTRTVLTDIQPNLPKWKSAAHDAPAAASFQYQDDFNFECGSFSYVATPVDAVNAEATVDAVVPNFGADGKEVRMIHLALHHFKPEQVKKMMQDAVAANAALVIIDHSPTAGGALYNWALAVSRLVPMIPSILKLNPIKVLAAPLMPVILAGLWHDATVSILRTYSQAELEEMIREANGGDGYKVQMFRSPGYGEWIGLPSFIRAIFPNMDDHVMNFVFATPPSREVYQKSRSPGEVPTSETKEGVKFYGAPASGIPESATLSARMQLVILLLLGYAYYKLVLETPKKKKREAGDADKLVGTPAILAVGTANPPHKWTNEEIFLGVDWKRTVLKMDDEWLDFMIRVHKTSGVQTRYFGDPAPEEHMREWKNKPGIYGKEEGQPTASERHTYWEEWCPKMAIDAATVAVNNWGGKKSDITHVVFHSCTGFKAPGVELDIIDALKLTNVKRRLGINYMGCFGTFTGMSVAKAFCDADPTATVLLVCSEACFAHLCFDENRSKSIGNCFFADGAGAMIIGAGRPGDWAISDQQTKTLGPETREMMTWRPSDFSYDMYLDKSIGLKFGLHLFWNLKSYLREICPESVRDIEWIVHPGGKGILDFFCSDKLGLGIDKSTLRRSYKVLTSYGNMSSGSIIFVLDDMMKEAKENPSAVKDTAVCFGFGPGLTMEIAELRRIGSTPGGPAVPARKSEPFAPNYEEPCKALPSDGESDTIDTEDDCKLTPSDTEDISVGTRTSDTS